MTPHRLRTMTNPRRSDYDVTNTVQVSSPDAVRFAIAKLFSDIWPAESLLPVEQSFVIFERMFSGTMPFMGVNFYEDIPAGDGKTTYGANFIPDDEVLAIAKKSCRYALVTGEKDFNRAGTKTVFEAGFKKEGFANVTYLEAPGVAHNLPPAKWLEQGLDFLDAGKGVKPVEAK